MTHTSQHMQQECVEEAEEQGILSKEFCVSAEWCQSVKAWLVDLLIGTAQPCSTSQIQTSWF